MAANEDEFVDALDSRLKCQNCSSVLESTFQTIFQTKCGHRYCDNCIEDIIYNGDSKCPVDGCKILSVELQCFCKNKNRGCKWSGQLADLEEHLKDCLYDETTCPNEGCSVTMIKRLCGRHMVYECRFKKPPQPLVEVGDHDEGIAETL